jgi:hypothetical protein
LGDAAGMIDVVVGEKHEVDAGDTGAFGSGNDAVGVAAFIARPAGIDEKRVVVGGDEERGLTAFDIDEVDMEIAGGMLGAESGAGEKQNAGEKCEGPQETKRWIHDELRGLRFLDRDIIDRARVA